MIWITRTLFLSLIAALFITFYVFLDSKTAEKKTPTCLKDLKSKDSKMISFSKEAYKNLGEGILGSESHRFKIELESSLKFLGANTRPDYSNALAFFSYKGNALVFNEKEKNPLCEISTIDFEQKSDYLFEVKLENSDAQIIVYQNVRPIFSLSFSKEKEPKPLLLDNYKLDNYILVRQKASYMGPDLFLKNHGGEEFEYTKDRVRIDFHHLSSPYFLFAKKGDFFVWKEGRWQEASEDSKKYPLFSVTKVLSDRFEAAIFDVSGCQRVEVQLTKSSKSSATKLSPLKFIGARSHQKWLFKADKNRLCLEPGDWIINLGHRWEKINSIDAIDHYVAHLNVGELFIVKELAEQEGKKVLKGELYNANRNEKSDCALDVSVEKRKSNSNKL